MRLCHIECDGGIQSKSRGLDGVAGGEGFGERTIPESIGPKVRGDQVERYLTYEKAVPI